MYQTVEGNLHMTTDEASERYPDSFIVMRMNSTDISNDMGTVLYIVNNQKEAFSLQFNSNISFGIVIEGLNLQCSLGGVVVGG